MRVLIRADGDSQIGIGHVMRTLAIAERVVAAGGEATLAGVRLDASLVARVRRRGVAVAEGSIEPGTAADAAWVIGQAATRAADWVVVDGYRFDAAYQHRLRSAGVRVLFVDDFGHCERYAAHIVLNQNVFASPDLYPVHGSDTRYLLGPKYALLRSEFAGRATTAPVIRDRADRILISLGGADPENAAVRIVDAMARLPDEALELRMVVGPSNPREAQLRARWSDPRIAVVPAADDMAPLMAWADLAVTGAGGTVYELACLGVPMLVVAIAEYQQALAEALGREGFAVDLGWHAVLDPEEFGRVLAHSLRDRFRRAELSQRGRELVDGRGAERVLDVLRAMMNS